MSEKEKEIIEDDEAIAGQHASIESDSIYHVDELKEFKPIPKSVLLKAAKNQQPDEFGLKIDIGGTLYKMIFQYPTPFDEAMAYRYIFPDLEKMDRTEQETLLAEMTSEQRLSYRQCYVQRLLKDPILTIEEIKTLDPRVISDIDTKIHAYVLAREGELADSFQFVVRDE